MSNRQENNLPASGKPGYLIENYLLHNESYYGGHGSHKPGFGLGTLFDFWDHYLVSIQFSILYFISGSEIVKKIFYSLWRSSLLWNVAENLLEWMNHLQRW